MAKELGEFMPIDEALAWVQKWRIRHFNKTLGVKDKVIITLAHHAVEIDKFFYGDNSPTESDKVEIENGD